jgi:hypothetical protein
MKFFICLTFFLSGVLTIQAAPPTGRNIGPIVPPGLEARPPAAAAQPSPDQVKRARGLLHAQPSFFLPNDGQMDDSVKFFSQAPGYSLFLMPQEAVLALSVPRQGGPPRAEVLRMSLRDASPNPRIEGADQMTSRSSYFLGNDRRKWRTGVPHYRKVHYHDVYPGIDMVYYGTGRQLEYDFVVAPGADPDRIRLRFDGARKIRMEDNGDLILRVGQTQVRQVRPVVYQEVASARVPVEGRYRVHGREVSFELGDYDPTRPLVIDPVLVYSTYLTGGAYDEIIGIGTNSQGHIVVAGNTTSPALPTTEGAFRNERTGGTDVFVLKLDPNPSNPQPLLYSTYLGGVFNDRVNAMAIDALGFVYLAGETNSSDWPVAGAAFQNLPGGDSDAFVAKVDTNAWGDDGLVYSSFYGGDRFEVATVIAPGENGIFYVAGFTTSLELPRMSGNLQAANRGGWDAFFARIDENVEGEGGLTYNSFLGGNSTDVINALIVEGPDRLILAGYTMSNDFPVTLGSIREFYADRGDGFFVRVDLARPGLDALLYGSYFGGSDLDVVTDAKLGEGGYLYLTGYTLSQDFPIVNGYQSANAGWSDLFIVRVNLDREGGPDIGYASLLGGGDAEVAYALAVHGPLVYITGYTLSRDFPIVGDPLQRTYGGAGDGFLVAFNTFDPPGPSIRQAGFIGGNSIDVCFGLTIDSEGRVHVAGRTQSSNYPITENHFQNAVAGLAGGFITKIEQF